MASFRSEFVQLGRQDVRIHVSLSEASPAATTVAAAETALTVVFLHYWGGSTRTWEAVASRVAAPSSSSAAAAAAGPSCQTVSVDFRGWGRSTGPEDDASASAYSIQALADDVEAVLAQLQQRGALAGRHGVVLVGLSMGAKVAQVVAARAIQHRHQHRDEAAAAGSVGAVRGVVLASPAPAGPLRLPPAMLEQQLHAYDNAASAAFVARNVLTQSFQGEAQPPLPAGLVEDMLRGNRWARAAWPAYAMAEDVTNTSLSRGAAAPVAPADEAGTADAPPPTAALPVLVLAAELDVVEPLDRVKSGVLAKIPGARLEVVAGSGHLSPVDAPDAVAAAILRFAGRVVESTGKGAL